MLVTKKLVDAIKAGMDKLSTAVGLPCNKYEYDLMQNNWKGIKGAGYNAVYEFCSEMGWVYSQLSTNAKEIILTPQGKKVCEEYENKLKSNRPSSGSIANPPKDGEVLADE